jgi:transcriptional accessory protein Tex/SPT6
LKDIASAAEQLKIGEPTLRLIIENLKKPGMDPRDDFPPPILRSTPMSGIEDLKPGDRIHATIANVVDFGAYLGLRNFSSYLIRLDIGVANARALLPFGRSRRRNELSIGATSNGPGILTIELLLCGMFTKKDPTEILNYLTTGDVIEAVIESVDLLQNTVVCSLSSSTAEQLENVIAGV